MKRVIVHIDSLVLKGFRREDRHAIADGLQQELSRVLAEPQTVKHLSVLGDVPRLQVDGVQIAQGSKPQRIGEKVARGIGKGMKT
ncbi:MAG: hypothetical protein ACTS6J_25120 [Burkholderiales bacterium]